MILLLLLVLSVAFIVVATAKFDLHAFLALIAAALLYGVLAGMPLLEIVEAIQDGFGGTIGAIGIVIIAGTIIGAFLEKSGGAFSIAEAVLRRVGDRHVPLTMSLVGYVVSIPVFADSGFVILQPLNRALTKRAGLSLATTAMALVMGLMASHTMMPPTPGPIAAAGILEADLGTVILLGLPISLVAMLIGWVFAIKIASRIYIDPQPDLSDEEIAAQLATAPKPAKAFAPILVPIILIVLKSIAEYPTRPFGGGFVADGLSFLGSPLIALLIGVAIAVTLPRKLDREMLSASGWVGSAVLNAAIIIIITGAGGAFGRVLQNSGIADAIGSAFVGVNIGLWLPFLIAAAIRAAQGSATVAMITTASIMVPMIGTFGLASEWGLALTVLAIGAGALVASHANDSMFWIATQMSDMDVRTGLKLQTVGTAVVGCGAALLIWIVGLVVL